MNEQTEVVEEEMDVVEDVATQPTALLLQAHRASGLPVEIPILWTDLASAQVGKEWTAVGGGSLYDARHSAVVVWRDDVRIVLLITEYYSDDERTENKQQLRAFSL